METTIRYKQFDVTVKVELERNFRESDYRISGHLRRVDDVKQPVDSWLTFKKFASEKAACEWGLQQSRQRIDASDILNRESAVPSHPIAIADERTTVLPSS